MSSALTRASPLKPEIRLAQAVSQFEADLSNEQKSAFRTLRSQSLSTAPSPDDVMRLTAEVDRRISAKFNSRCFGPRFTNFLQGVQQFAALGDVVVGGSQNLVACGVWSVVRMSLLSFVNLQGYIDKLSSLFMAIGRAAPRYQAIVLLYPRSRRLQSYLNEYFIAVVGLCHYLFKFGQKSTVLQFTSALNDSHLKTFHTELDKWANSIREEMDLAEAQESSGSRALAIEFFKSSSRRQDHASRMQVLDFCSKYDHQTAWKQIRKAGNASFYARCMEYQDWKNCSHSSTMIYTGKLGSGKSVLLSNIVDDLNLSTDKKQNSVAYFFCKHDVPESLQARTIIGSLIQQLLRTIQDISALAIHCENTYGNNNVEELLKLLFLGFPSYRKAYLVLDGFDECDLKEKQALILAVQEIQDRLQVLLCISFREEPNNGLDSIIGQLCSTRVVSLPDDNPDIETFIEADLERCLGEGILTIGDPALILEIQDALLKGSQGMFLWVALQIQTLCSMKTDRAIREALENLPKDLSETFARILQKSGSLDPSLQTKTLQLLLAAYRPLTTDELREALSVAPGDAKWDPSRLLHDVYSALSCCGCLVVVDEEEFTVRLVHHSFKQYILNRLDGVKHTESFLREAQRTMADIVITYLNYGVFGTEVSRAKATPIMAQFAPAQIVQATMASSRNRRYLAMKFLKSRRQPEFDIIKVLAEAQSNFKSEKDHVFRFYTYAEQHWQVHLYHVSGNNEAIFKLSSKVIHSRPYKLNEQLENFCAHLKCAYQEGNGDLLMMLALQTGSIDLNAIRIQGRPLINWAAFYGYTSMVEMLMGTGKVNPNIQGVDGRTPLTAAVSNGHTKIVEVLLKSGRINVDARQRDWRTALVIAASDGKKEILELLLATGKAAANVIGPYNETALILAVERGDTDIARLLLSTGNANVEAEGFEGRTALMYAARKGHTGIAKLLITVGKANVEAKDLFERTALMHAVQNENKDVVEFLLTTGKADVDVRGYGGNTALLYAIKTKNRDIAELLVTTGKANLDIQEDFGDTALIRAVRNQNEHMAQLLLATGKADINIQGRGGDTALIRAVRNQNEQIVRLLLATSKVDVNIKGFKRETALIQAVQNKDEGIVMLLIAIGKADVNIKGFRGDTALIHATRGGSMAMIELLVYIGQADPHIQNELGESAFGIAKEFGRVDLVRLFEGTRV